MLRERTIDGPRCQETTSQGRFLNSFHPKDAVNLDGSCELCSGKKTETDFDAHRESRGAGF